MQRAIFFLLTAIIVIGTGYSLFFETYLDTSDPLLTHLPHPLGKTHYFASKTNLLNVYFIKKAWAWTTAAFFFSWITSPAQVKTKSRLVVYLTLTTIWVLFTSWFFGPAIFERVILASGGECILPGPLGMPIVVPNEYCFTRSTISPTSHPELFLASKSYSDNSPVTLPETFSTFKAVPRLRKGHDVSGHLFILTMSTLFLADQLHSSFRYLNNWSQIHYWSVATNITLICTWLFASLTTSVYFHSPFEKLTGYLLGIAAYAISQSPFIWHQPTLIEPVAVEKQRTSNSKKI